MFSRLWYQLQESLWSNWLINSCGPSLGICAIHSNGCREHTWRTATFFKCLGSSGNCTQLAQLCVQSSLNAQSSTLCIYITVNEC